MVARVERHDRCEVFTILKKCSTTGARFGHRRVKTPSNTGVGRGQTKGSMRNVVYLDARRTPFKTHTHTHLSDGYMYPYDGLQRVFRHAGQRQKCWVRNR